MSLQLKCGSCTFQTAPLPEAGAIASLRAHTNSVHIDWRTRQQQQLIQQARQKQHHVITEHHNKATAQTAIGSSERTTGCTAITRQQQPTHQEAQEDPEQPAVPPTPAQKPAAKDDAARSPAKRATKTKKPKDTKEAPLPEARDEEGQFAEARPAGYTRRPAETAVPSGTRLSEEARLDATKQPTYLEAHEEPGLQATAPVQKPEA